METNSDFCVACSAKDEHDHKDMWLESSTDLAVLLVLKEHGYAETLDRIIRDWRTHVLPTCDPLSIN